MERNKSKSDNFSDRINYFRNAKVVEFLAFKATYLEPSPTDDIESPFEDFQEFSSEDTRNEDTTILPDSPDLSTLKPAVIKEEEKSPIQSSNYYDYIEKPKKKRKRKIDNSSMTPVEEPTHVRKKRGKYKKKDKPKNSKQERDPNRLPCPHCTQSFLQDFLLQNHIRGKHLGI